MFFLTKKTNAQFYNDSKVTFLVRTKSVDIIFKIKRGVYLTVSVSSLDEECLLLSCVWGDYFQKIAQLSRKPNISNKLKKECPLLYSICNNKAGGIYLAYLDSDRRNGYVVSKMNVAPLTHRINDFIDDAVIKKAMELVNFNLDLFVEIEEKCPFHSLQNELANFYSNKDSKI